MALHWGRPESPFPPYHRPDSGFGWTGAHGYGNVAAGAPPSASAPGSGSGSVSASGGGGGGGGGGKRRVVRPDGSDEDDEPTIRPPVRRKRPRVTLDTYDPVRTGASPADQLDYPSDHSRSSSRNSNPGYVYLGPTSVPSYLANPNSYTYHADYNYSSYNGGASASAHSSTSANANAKVGANVGANPSAAATANNPYPSPGPNPTNPGPYHNPAATADWVRHGSSRSGSDPDPITALPAPTMERGLSNTSSSSGISSALSVSSSAAFSFRSSSSSSHHLYQQQQQQPQPHQQQQQQQHHHHHHQIPPPQHSHHLVPAATAPPVCFTDTLPSRVTTPNLSGPAGPLAGEVERTASGFSISSEEAAPDYDLEDQYDTTLVSDAQAGRDSRAFLDAFLRRNPDSQHERILRSLVESRGGDNELDFRAMFGIFTSANELFFGRCLTDRVKWDWSDGASAKYTEHVIGTTVVRRVPQGGGYETLIVLSRPILREGGYSRRLAISTFLHELIHCFLFVRCGFRARLGGGHTPAFREIAGMVDDWIGPGLLYLSDMSADLTRFLQCQDAASSGVRGGRRSTESSASSAASSSAHAPAEYYHDNSEYSHPYPYPYQSPREAQQQQPQQLLLPAPAPPRQSGQSPRLYRRAASHVGRHQRRLSEGPFRPPPLPPPPPLEQREYNEYERDYERHQRNGDERHQSSEYERGYDRHQNNEYEREYGRRQVNEYERDYERHQNNSNYERDHERDTAGRRTQDHHQRDYAVGYDRDHERGYTGNYEPNRERDYPPQQQQQQQVQVQQHDFDPRHLLPHRESRPHNPHYHYDNNNNNHHHHPSHHGQSHSLPPPLPRALSPDQQLQQYLSSARRSAGSRAMMRPVESRHGVWYDGVEDDCVCDVEGTDGMGAGGH